MRKEASCIVEGDELRLIAAMSGLDTVALFTPETEFEYGRQMQALIRLIGDRLFTNSDGKLMIGKVLEDFSQALSCAERIVVAHVESCEKPPICIYYSISENRYACITPHGLKEASYKVYTGAFNELVEDLTQLGFLPQQGSNSQYLPEQSDEVEGYSYGSIGSIPRRDILSTFERYSRHKNNSCGKLCIIWSTNAWSILQDTDRSKAIRYSSFRFLKWLEGF